MPKTNISLKKLYSDLKLVTGGKRNRSSRFASVAERLAQRKLEREQGTRGPVSEAKSGIDLLLKHGKITQEEYNRRKAESDLHTAWEKEQEAKNARAVSARPTSARPTSAKPISTKHQPPPEPERPMSAKAKKNCDPYFDDTQIQDILNNINCDRKGILLTYHPDKLNGCDQHTVTENYTRMKNKFNNMCTNKIP